MSNKVKKFLRENWMTKGIYRFLWSLKNWKAVRASRKKRVALQKNGIALIHFLQDVLCEEKFFFDFGTLLGIVRENRILGHDLDVDLGIFLDGEAEIKRVRELLYKNGCKIAYSYSIDEIGIVEDSFIINNIKFDICYYCREENVDVSYLMYKTKQSELKDGEMNVVKTSCSHINKLEKINFKGKMINVPENKEAYLVERYGKNWTIPDKNYVYWKGPSVAPTDYIGHIIKYI